MAFLARVPGFRFTSLNAPVNGGGGTVKVKIRRALLAAAGDVGAKIEILGRSVYLPQNGQITVGRSKKSDIRIVDPFIDLNHLVLSHTDDGIEVANYSLSIPLKIQKRNGITIELASFDVADMDQTSHAGKLEHGDSILLGLERSQGPLNIKIALPGREDLVLAPITSTAMLPVQSSMELTPHENFRALVADTEFKLATTPLEMVPIYKSALKKTKNTSRFVGGLNSVLSLQSGVLSIINLANHNLKTAAVLGAFSLANLCVALFQAYRTDIFRGRFVEVLSKLSDYEISLILQKIDEKEQDWLLELLTDENPVLASKVTPLLPEGRGEQPALPEESEPVEALPQARDEDTA